jgi:hypothetical protein
MRYGDLLCLQVRNYSRLNELTVSSLWAAGCTQQAVELLGFISGIRRKIRQCLRWHCRQSIKVSIPFEERRYYLLEEK